MSLLQNRIQARAYIRCYNNYRSFEIDILKNKYLKSK